MTTRRSFSKLISILAAVIITFTNIAAFTTAAEAQSESALQLVSPAGLQTINQPVYSWVDLGRTDIQIYELKVLKPNGEISTTAFVPGQIVVNNGIANLSTGEVLAAGEYSWTARYSIDGTNYSDYSTPLPFTIPSAIDVQTATDQTNLEPTSTPTIVPTETFVDTTVEEITVAEEVVALANLALGQTASQSSTYSSGAANRAIDGNTNGVYSKGSVTHTKKTTQPWWQLDLGSVQSISTIDIWNRTDCCTARLQKFYVMVSDVPFGTNSLKTARAKAGVSSYYVSSVAGVPTTIDVYRTGRYVKIQLAGTNYLSLAEVQVWNTGEISIAEESTPTSTSQPVSTTVAPTSTPVTPSATQVPPTAVPTNMNTATTAPTATYTSTTAPTKTYTPTTAPTNTFTPTTAPTKTYTPTTAPTKTYTPTTAPTKTYTPTTAPTKTYTPTTAPTKTYTPTTAPTAIQTVANAYYVSTTGSDSNPGTLASPWKTLSYASTKVKAGTTLFIRGGTYYEVTSWSVDGTESSPITIKNYPGETVVIDGYDTIPANTGGTWMFMVWGDWYYVSGLEVTRSFDEGAIGVKGEHVTIDNCYTHHNWGAGITLMGNYDTAQYNDVWYNGVSNENASLSRGGWPAALTCARSPYYCTLKGNTSWENWGEGISTFEAYYTTIEDNVSYNNMQNFYMSDTKYSVMQRNISYCTSGNAVDTYYTQNGILVGDEKQSPASSDNKIINNIVYGCDRNLAIGTTESTNNIVANNTFVNTDGEANILMYSGTCSNCQFANNLVVQEDSKTISINAGTGWTFTNNLWSKTPSSSVTGTSSIIADPKLAKSGNYTSGSYYQLLSTSPAINSGKYLSQIIEDFLGDARDASIDIGALEY